MYRTKFLLLAAASTMSTSVAAGDPEVTKYEYDALGRLISVTKDDGAEGSQSILYDAAGNRTNFSSTPPLGTGVSFSINNKSATEGGNLVFTVSKAGTAYGTLTVSYATATGSASSSDFTAKSGTLSFGASETSKTITVASTQDAIDENNEDFYVNLSSPAAASTISDSQGKGTIVDDDDPLGTGTSFSINNKSATEGSNLVFTVTKSGGANGALTINYATATGSAGSSDFTAKSGTLSFGTSETSKTISVASTQDTIDENNETFYVNLSNAQGAATIFDSQGSGTIVDDDDPSGTGVSFSINNKSATEGGNLVFTVSKSGTATGALTINYATQNGTAGSSDYTAKSGTLSFGTSETSKTISVASTQDNAVESNETFKVNLSNAQGAATISDSQGIGTIIDNDDPPSFSISDASVVEGGTLSFTVTKTGSASGTYTIAFATADGSASAGTDYTAKTGTLTFTTSTTTQTITVSTTDDTQYEYGAGSYETMFVNLSSASGGATITDAQAVGSIEDNDANPVCEAKPWIC